MGNDVNYTNIDLIDEMFAKWEKDPLSVDASWREFFQKAESPKARQHNVPSDLRIYNLINAYRRFGHLEANVDPIGKVQPAEQLAPETLGFTKADLDQLFPTNGLLPEREAKLSEIVAHLRKIYCGTIGFEYCGIPRAMEQWLQERIESSAFKLSIDEKRMILHHLNKSELLEVFIHTKYVGQKRFSLEGGETLIPMLGAVVERGARHGIEEIVLGMAHRGRINVLSNILDKSYSDIFSEFEEGYIPESFEGSGDVKYHKGFYSEVKTVHGTKMRITLTPNPSHLEAVDAVVEGQARAKQTIRGPGVLPVLIHGDAALSGQGVVYETLQMMHLDGYSTNGTLHFVVNNQIGFTTSPKDGRSTHYCTDIAKAFEVPVFHVNAEDPEGCLFATYLALDFRNQFETDVFVEMNCYRKYGHNESDEPAFTQPTQYQNIREKKPIREIYRDDLIHQGVVEKAMAESLEEEFRKSLSEALERAKQPLKSSRKESEPTSPLLREPLFKPVETALPEAVLREVADGFCFVPKGFHLHKKLVKLIEDRLSMVRENEAAPIDWGMGEMLAYGTLLWQNRSVRLAGQDSGRGTFSHRHALWSDQSNDQPYIALQHLKPEQGRFELVNSLLSEYAALGFEYGYSLGSDKTLVLWEAQFGDFCNGAQVIIDQFITTSEQKWGQMSALTLLLPHGYEGQGPEHSSGRMERFLTLCGDNNIQVVNPTTPAQLFHLLRRQALRPFRKPLVVFTPKGLLRHPACVSQLSDFSKGTFEEILEESQPNKKARRLLFCSGRIYYDLVAEREKSPDVDIAIIRIEQLYPLHEERLAQLIKEYKATEYFWVQEEPSNMGAWSFIAPQLLKVLPKIAYIGRERSASPAVGSHAVHLKQYQEIMQQIFSKQKPTIFEIASQKGRS